MVKGNSAQKIAQAEKAGSIGEIGVFSFYPDKIMSSADGGIMVTDDYDIYQKMLRFRNVGRNSFRFMASHCKTSKETHRRFKSSQRYNRKPRWGTTAMVNKVDSTENLGGDLQ